VRNRKCQSSQRRHVLQYQSEDHVMDNKLLKTLGGLHGHQIVTSWRPALALIQRGG
jgi:hypothetical protein